MQNTDDSHTNTASRRDELFKRLAEIVGADHVITEECCLEEATSNSLGVERRVLGIVWPASVDEVQAIVLLANRLQTPLYPVSRGRNIGYGEKAPCENGQLLVELSRLNQIREFDVLSGRVVVEPGVTQQQLYEFLKEQNAPYWMDPTGAPLDSSLVGCTLEGGFGHTPRGNRRKEVTNLELVLGNGTLLTTGTFPGMGPDLSGLFIQSNFGIVTAIELRLNPIPECFCSFALVVDSDRNFPALIDSLRTLRQRETITSMVHIANSTRFLMTTGRVPERFINRPMSTTEANAFCQQMVPRVGAWSACGGLYGSVEEVRAKVKVIKRTVRGHARAHFFTTRRLNVIRRIVALPPFRSFHLARELKRCLASYQTLHDLLRGIPSNEPARNISWRYGGDECCGLIWFCPVLRAEGQHLNEVLQTAGHLYLKHGFEMPVTVTFIEPDKLIASLNILYDRFDDRHAMQAHSLHRALKAALRRDGIAQYRAGVHEMAEIRYRDEGKAATFAALKRALDPANVIAPGRYGIGGVNE